MEYIIKTAYSRASQISRPYRQTGNHRIEWLDSYRAGSLPSYVRPSSVDELARPHYRPRKEPRVPYYDTARTQRRYLYVSRIKTLQLPAYKRRSEHVENWAKLVYPPVMTYSKNCKGVDKKSEKMGIRLMELKTDGSHYEFVIRDTFTATVVTWECLPEADAVRQYLKEHPFPEDSLYPEKAFVEDVEKASGYIHLMVEKRKTAEFVCHLCCALI